MTILIAATGWDGEAWVKRIREALPGRDVITTERDGTWGGNAADLGSVDHVLAWHARQDVLDRVTNPRVLFSLGAGVDHLLSRKLPAGVPVVRIVDPDLTARMAEYVAWQVLHHHRQGAAYAGLQRARQWKDLGQWPASAVTVGLLGFGILGQAAAEVLKKLGFQLGGWSRTPKPVQGVRNFAGAEQLDDFLAGTDILVSLLPLTPDTTGFIDAKLLGRLRRDGPLGGPVFINAGRGRTHVEADVVAALRDGRLKAASLDVTEVEPLPADSPLWDMPNVVITPHIAAESSPDALVQQIAEQIVAFERGEPLKNVVDPQRGY